MVAWSQGTFEEWAATALDVGRDAERVAAYVLEPGASPTVTFLHGFQSSSFDVAQVAALLDGVCIVALDFPGFGASAKTANGVYSIHGAADAVERVWHHAGVTETVLLAHDYGGSASARSCWPASSTGPRRWRSTLWCGATAASTPTCTVPPLASICCWIPTTAPRSRPPSMRRRSSTAFVARGAPGYAHCNPRRAEHTPPRPGVPQTRPAPTTHHRPQRWKRARPKSRHHRDTALAPHRRARPRPTTQRRQRIGGSRLKHIEGGDEEVVAGQFNHSGFAVRITACDGEAAVDQFLLMIWVESKVAVVALEDVRRAMGSGGMRSRFQVDLQGLADNRAAEGRDEPSRRIGVVLGVVRVSETGSSDFSGE
jgi:pimeloyl-ACP methyl ester carboxylesterase